MKPLIYLFIAIAILAYGAIRFDQLMGWEDERAKKSSYIGVL
jgi:hypothetical protein